MTIKRHRSVSTRSLLSHWSKVAKTESEKEERLAILRRRKKRIFPVSHLALVRRLKLDTSKNEHGNWLYGSGSPKKKIGDVHLYVCFDIGHCFGCHSTHPFLESSTVQLGKKRTKRLQIIPNSSPFSNRIIDLRRIIMTMFL